MNNKSMNTIRKLGKKLGKSKSVKALKSKAKYYAITVLGPILLILLLVCTMVDFLFMSTPKTVNAAENAELKNYAISCTDTANVSKLTLADGTKLTSFCDANGADIGLALKWSDLYAMVVLEDNTTLESFNADSDNTLVKQRFDTISSDLAPKIIYIQGNRKVTLTKTTSTKDPVTKKVTTTTTTSVVSDDVLYYMKTADTLYGITNNTYKTKTEVKTDSEGTWTTTSLELVSSNETDKYKRLDAYLKSHVKASDNSIEQTRQIFLELSAGIFANTENAGWLIGKGGLNGGGLDWASMGATDINPSIMNAIMTSSKKYAIPPWLIMGFLYRESSFTPNLLTYPDYRSKVIPNPTLAEVGDSAWGLMQVCEWERIATSAGYPDAEKALSDINAQVDVGCYELVIEKFGFTKTNPKTVDWQGSGWIEQSWLGCQAYNGLIYYNSNPAKTKKYAFSQYLRRPEGTGVFDMAEKYKTMFSVNANNELVQNSSWPVPSCFTVTSPFGMRMHPVQHRPIFHQGIDIGGASGAKIVSASNGVVVQASDAGNGYGNCVVVRNKTHDFLYAHMSSISVRVGDKVTISKQLGLVGSTGMSTGPHLHFGISNGDWHNMNWIDPLTIVLPNN